MRTTAAALFLCLPLAGAAYAHGDTTPRHGGVVQLVGETSFELVFGEDGAELYLIDDAEPLPSEGMTGKLTVVSGDSSDEWNLVPAGGNRLTARGARAASGSKVVIQVTRTDGFTKMRARFTLT